MLAYDSCPFCGDSNAIIDTINYASGHPAKFRVQCQRCHANTGWKDTEGDAIEAWNTRAVKNSAPQKELNRFVNKHLFIYRGVMYIRNPSNEMCYRDQEGKMKRIRKNDFLLAYADCQKILGAFK
jgi:Lar family restriction alleviation protein